MAFTPVNDGDLAVAPQLQQLLDALQGVAGAGQPIDLTALDDDVNYALTVRNLGSGGLALDVRGSDNVSRLQVTDAGVIFGGTIGFSAGTASAPSIFRTGDTNTGIYWPTTSDIIGLATGGTERVRISASGLTISSGSLIGSVLDQGGFQFNVKAYGAIGDGATHLLSNTYATLAAAQAVYPGATSLSNTTDEAAIMTAIAAAPKGSLLYFPPGTYMLSQTLVINKALRLLGHLGGQDSLGGLQGNEATVIQWCGAANGTMIEVVASTPFDNLSGGGIDGLVLDGYVSDALIAPAYTTWDTVVAGIGLLLKGTNHFRVGHLRIRNILQYGLWLDDYADATHAGHATDNLIEQLDFNCGFWSYDATHPLSDGHMIGSDAVGLYLHGSSVAALGSATKNRILQVRGVFYDGDLVRLRYADNNQIDHIHPMGPVDTTGFPQAPAGGRVGLGEALRFQTAVQFADRATYPWAYGFPAGNVVVMMHGSVMAENYTHGNWIMQHQTEGSRIRLQDPTKAQLHYESMDYVALARYRTHSYRMTDEVHLGAGALLPGASVTFAEVGGPPWGGWALPTASTTRVHGWARPYDWNGGTVTAIRVEFMMSTSVASKQVTLRARAETATAGASANALAAPAATLEADVAVTASVPNAAGIRAYVDLPINIAYHRGDAISFFVQRESAGATEHTGDLVLLGATLVYQSTGPLYTAVGDFTAGPPPYSPFSPTLVDLAAAGTPY